MVETLEQRCLLTSNATDWIQIEPEKTYAGPGEMGASVSGAGTETTWQYLGDTSTRPTSAAPGGQVPRDSIPDATPDSVGTAPDSEDAPLDEPMQVSGGFLTDGAELPPGGAGAKTMTFDEVEQGASDTCAFSAALSAVALSNFDLASGISVATRKSETDIVYNVRLFDPTPGRGLPRADQHVEFVGNFQPDDTRSTDSDEFWVTLYYRAYRDLEQSSGLDYHRTSEALEALTGAATSWTSIGDVTPALLGSWLDSGSPVVASSADARDAYNVDPAEGVIGDHAYTVLGIEGSGAGTYVTLRNPWASDSTYAYAETIDGVDDGIIRIPYATFAKYFEGATRSLITGPPINSPQAPPPTFTSASPGTITIRQGESVDLDFSAVDSRGRPVHYDLYGGGGFDAFLGWSSGHFQFLAGSNDVWTHTWTVKASSDPLSAASQTFSVTVLANQPTVGGVSVTPSSINASGSDRLTLQASGLTMPAGTVDSVAFYLGTTVSGSVSLREVGTATAATGWAWNGYVGGLEPGTYHVFGRAHGEWNGLQYNGYLLLLNADVDVTPAPDYQPKITAMANQFRVSPDGYSAIGLGTTVDAEGHVRVFWDNASYGDIADSTPVNQFLVREYDSAGQPLADPVTLTAGASYLKMAFAGLPDGSFDEVYTVENTDATTHVTTDTIKVQRYSGAAAPIGEPITVASGLSLKFASSPRTLVDAAVDAAGNLLIAYAASGATTGPDIYAATLSASGAVIRAPWRVNSHTVGAQGDARVALDASGDGIITWDDADDHTIMGRRVSGAGTSNDPAELYVYQDPSLSYSVEDVGVDAPGNITVAFGDSKTIHVRRYGADGSDGGEQVAFAAGTTDVSNVRLAVNDQGWAFLAWDEKQAGDVDVDETRGKLINPEGRIQSTSLLVPTATAAQQSMYNGGVAFNDRGQISVLFTQLDPDDPELARMAVFARLYRADMAPEFAGGPYHLSVPLGSPAGTIVGSVEATDPDGDPVLYSLQGSGAFAVDPTTGVVTVADASAVSSTAIGSYNLRVQADDGNPTANVKPTAPVVVSVAAQPPTIAPMPDWTIDANESLALRIGATDPAGAALAYSAAVEGAAPVTVSVVGGLLIVRPARDYTGTFRVDLTASNGLASATTSFGVSVVVPVLAPLADRAVDLGPLSITLAGSDASGAALTYRAIADDGSATPPATVTIANDVLTIVPRAGYSGTMTVTATVSSGPASASRTFHITVNPGQGAGDGPPDTIPITSTPLVTMSHIQLVLNRRGRVTQILVTFGGALDVGEAQDLGNYRLATAGRRGSFTARKSRPIRLRTAAYDVATGTVALTPMRAFKLSRSVQLQVSGQPPSGLEDRIGRLIDGDRDGQAGGNAVTVLRRGMATIRSAGHRRTRTAPAFPILRSYMWSDSRRTGRASMG